MLKLCLNLVLCKQVVVTNDFLRYIICKLFQIKGFISSTLESKYENILSLTIMKYLMWK